MRTKEEIGREIRVVQESLRLLEAELTEVLAAEAQFKVGDVVTWTEYDGATKVAMVSGIERPYSELVLRYRLQTKKGWGTLERKAHSWTCNRWERVDDGTVTP